jgi:Protein of unknown function (DUF2815)
MKESTKVQKVKMTNKEEVKAIGVGKGKDGNVYSDKLITPMGRLSYPSLFTRAVYDGEEGKYECTLYIPKKANVQQLFDTAEAVAKLAFPEKFKGLSNLPNEVIRDGDHRDCKDTNAAGCWIIRAKSKNKPDVIGPRKENCEPDHIYGGCWARISCVIGSYNTKGSWGVTIYLNNVQKMKDDDKFGKSNTKAVDEFAEFESSESESSQEANF